MTATRHECVSKDLFLQKYKGLMFRCFKSRKKGLGNCIWLLRLFETIKINCCNDLNFIFFSGEINARLFNLITNTNR